MGGLCSKASDSVCKSSLGKGCGFSCQCMTCSTGNRCDCSCRWLVVAGFALFLLSSWVALIAYREKRKWLLTWASIYALASFILTSFTHYKGPDSHEWYGCTLPLSFWALFLFLTTLSYYTTDYMQQGALEHERGEKYVYDPKKGEYVERRSLRDFHAI